MRKFPHRKKVHLPKRKLRKKLRSLKKLKNRQPLQRKSLWQGSR